MSANSFAEKVWSPTRTRPSGKAWTSTVWCTPSSGTRLARSRMFGSVWNDDPAGVSWRVDSALSICSWRSGVPGSPSCGRSPSWRSWPSWLPSRSLWESGRSPSWRDPFGSEPPGR
ncbi:hypothetical protein [Saccharopolyspora rhizosphaerae]|nr:hypothetical protein [Saccharopolyspora rhizosphaerae]